MGRGRTTGCRQPSQTWDPWRWRARRISGPAPRPQPSPVHNIKTSETRGALADLGFFWGGGADFTGVEWIRNSAKKIIIILHYITQFLDTCMNFYIWKKFTGNNFRLLGSLDQCFRSGSARIGIMEGHPDPNPHEKCWSASQLMHIWTRFNVQTPTTDCVGGYSLTTCTFITTQPLTTCQC